jgi:hypothetical protein
MRDLRNPGKRAEWCMSCHVGNAAEGKVVTHAMYAATHPVLRGFDLASFSKNLPQHWWNLKEVPYLQTAPIDVQKLASSPESVGELCRGTCAHSPVSSAALREDLWPG